MRTRTYSCIYKYIYTYKYAAVVFHAKIISRFPPPTNNRPRQPLLRAGSVFSPILHLSRFTIYIQQCSRILYYIHTHIHAHSRSRTYVCYMFFIIIFHSISPKRFAPCAYSFFFLDNKFYPRPRPAPFDLSRSAKLLHTNTEWKNVFPARAPKLLSFRSGNDPELR